MSSFFDRILTTFNRWIIYFLAIPSPSPFVPSPSPSLLHFVSSLGSLLPVNSLSSSSSLHVSSPLSSAPSFLIWPHFHFYFSPCLLLLDSWPFRLIRLICWSPLPLISFTKTTSSSILPPCSLIFYLFLLLYFGCPHLLCIPSSHAGNS